MGQYQRALYDDYSETARWGTNGTGDGQFFAPNGVAVAPDGSFYIADRFNHRIQKFSVRP